MELTRRTDNKGIQHRIVADNTPFGAIYTIESLTPYKSALFDNIWKRTDNTPITASLDKITNVFNNLFN